MDIKDVESLAVLARIELGEDEKNELLSDMKGILEYVKQIERSSAERPSAEVASAPAALPFNIWREDIVEVQEFSKELITEQFPDSQDGFLKVKKIL